MPLGCFPAGTRDCQQAFQKHQGAHGMNSPFGGKLLYAQAWVPALRLQASSFSTLTAAQAAWCVK